MGYTHYWRYSPTKLKGWESAIADCDKIVAATKAQFELLIRNGEDERDELWINGPDDKRDLGHEDFVVPRTLAAVKAEVENRREQFASFGTKAEIDSQARFAFCKTAQKPYDIVVVACLCILSETGLEVSSDGDSDEWQAGHALAEEILGRSVAKPIEGSE